MKELTHIDGEGRVRMVDVSGKRVVKRTAVAEGFVSMSHDTLATLRDGLLKKGDPLITAQIAGIQAAKRTGELIPLCHPLPVDEVRVELEPGDRGVRIRATVTTMARTGVEMEALTAVSVAALTVYDMCKAVDKAMVIGEITLRSKTKEER